MKILNGICRICGITRYQNGNDFMASGTICYNCYCKKQKENEQIRKKITEKFRRIFNEK